MGRDLREKRPPCKRDTTIRNCDGAPCLSVLTPLPVFSLFSEHIVSSSHCASPFTQLFSHRSPPPFARAKGLLCFIMLKSTWHVIAIALRSSIATIPCCG